MIFSAAVTTVNRLRGFQTEAIHGPGRDDAAVSPPIALTTTWAWPSVEAAESLAAAREPERFYRRLGAPNLSSLEVRLARLEGAERALGVASGMAAVTLALMTALPQGGHVVCARTVYGEAANFLKGLSGRMGITASFVATTAPEDYRAALRPDTRVIFVECPANPTLDVVDLAAIAEIAHRHGAIVVVDATLATPYNCRPIELGCDVVVHSATKYMAGHSDAMGGVIAGTDAFIQQAHGLLRVMGSVLSPFDAWLIERGLKTLGLRMARHNASAEHLADVLARHPKVARVAYPTVDPGLSDRVRAQHRGFGGVMGVELVGGAEAAARVVSRLELFTLATSLGGVESLVQFPASMAKLSPEDRARLGIPAGLIRLAIGCEDADDLARDLDRALSLE